MRFRVVSLILLGAMLALSTPAIAQVIVQSAGVDARVDYASLSEYGPWDDRNYKLTAEDLQLLSPNELELSVQIPLFFRVELRRSTPGMLIEGPLQYPRSALPRFFIKYGGFLINGHLYRSVGLLDGRPVVDLSLTPAMTEAEFVASKALEGDVRVTSPTGAAESAIAINP
ncbi:MAG: hypothetical protein DRJ65_15235, partial [Acidobacteria bacterium]